MSSLWAEVVGEADTGRFLVRRLERTLDGLAAYLAHRTADPVARAVRAEAGEALRRGEAMLRGRPRGSSGRSVR